MNKIFSIAVIGLTSMMFSCSSCNKTNESSDAGNVISDANNDSLKKENVVLGSSWELILPADWQKQDPNKLDIDGAEFLAIQPNNKGFMLLTKKEYSGNIDNFTLKILSAIRKEGAILLRFAKQDINGVNFVIVDVKKRDITLTFWITVHDGFGYGVGCGIDSGPLANVTSCQNIVSTLKIRNGTYL